MSETLKEGGTRREDSIDYLIDNRPYPNRKNHKAEEKANGKVGTPNP
jgi:hypothetical protein